MKDRLLTNKEIREYSLMADKEARDLTNSTEGCFKPEDIDNIYEDAGRDLVKSQDRRTLKAVGEWLADITISGNAVANELKIVNGAIKLKRGEMPK